MQKKHPKIIEFAGTPEAGKTTAIRCLADFLTQQHFTVEVIRESAEIVPSVFPKGDYSANLWMRLNTTCKILEMLYTHVDFVLVDRGSFDASFWPQMYKENISKEHLESTLAFYDSLHICKPDLLFCLFCSPETSIKRRGGEGRIVTAPFLWKYNEILTDCFENYTGLKVNIATDDLTIEEMNNEVFSYFNSLFYNL